MKQNYTNSPAASAAKDSLTLRIRERIYDTHLKEMKDKIPYIPLADAALSDFFSSSVVRNHLLKQGLIDENGRILKEDEYKQRQIEFDRKIKEEQARRLAEEAEIAREIETQVRKQLEREIKAADTKIIPLNRKAKPVLVKKTGPLATTPAKSTKRPVSAVPAVQPRSTLKMEALKKTPSEREVYFEQHKIWRPTSRRPESSSCTSRSERRTRTRSNSPTRSDCPSEAHDTVYQEAKSHSMKYCGKNRPMSARPGRNTHPPRPGSGFSEFSTAESTATNDDQYDQDGDWDNFFVTKGDADPELEELMRPTRSTHVSRPTTSRGTRAAQTLEGSNKLVAAESTSNPASTSTVSDHQLEPDKVARRLKEVQRQERPTSASNTERVHSFERVYSNKSGLSSRSNSKTKLSSQSSSRNGSRNHLNQVEPKTTKQKRPQSALQHTSTSSSDSEEGMEQTAKSSEILS